MAAASGAVRGLVTGPSRSARVLAAFPLAVYLQVDPPDGTPAEAAGPGPDPAGSGGVPGARGTVDGPDQDQDQDGGCARVLALLARDAVRLPIGLVLAEGRADTALGGLSVGDRLTVGAGGIRAGGGAGGVRVLRWWDPRVPALGRPVQPRLPVPPPVPPELAVPVDRLAAALGSGGTGLDPAVRGLVGLGPGLTPAGDDVLCGALAALAATDPDGHRRLAGPVRRHARGTGTVSAALLRAAAEGYGLPELTRLLRAVLRPGTGDRTDTALAGVLAVGHTSGAALAVGALLALAHPPAPTREEAA